MKAYETSTMTLKSLLAHPALNRDKINETMEAMAEATADHAEVEAAINLGGEGVAVAAGMTIDEDALQAELQQMVEEKEKEEMEMKEMEALEKARKEQARLEIQGREAEEREQQTEKQHKEAEERERKRILVESGRATPVSGEEEQQWEERWLVAQAEKVAQAHRDREAETKRRARWEVEDRTEVHAA